MNIKTVVVINDFNYIQGGASKVAIETANILMSKGLKVYFFSAVNRIEDNIKGIEYVTTNQNEALKEKNKLKGFFNGLYNFKSKKTLKVLLSKLDRKTTIINVHGWTKALSSSIFDIAFKMKFKVVLTLHDYFTACPNGGYFNYKDLEICTLKPLSFKCIKCNCDSRNYIFKVYRILRQFIQNNIVRLNLKLKYAISISNFSENIIRKALNKKIEIERIYNPIDIENNREKINIAENQYFLYVGRISKEKGVDIFCKAIENNNYKGIVVGEGDCKTELEKQYKNIVFTGWKNDNEIKEYMRKAKALIFPSRWYEGAPLITIEAAAIGLPSIVSDKCAAKEFIKDYENGLIFDGTVEDLEKKIKEYEELDLEIVSRNTYNYYKRLHFSNEEYCSNIIKYFDKILEKDV